MMFLRKTPTYILSLILFVNLCFSICYSEEVKGKYIIGPGDVLEINVWNHPELKKPVAVRPDGWISFPLAGEVRAAGLNPEVLAGRIRQQLLQYLKDPKVSVMVNEYKSKKVLVLGEVYKPGLYQFEGGMTAFEAIGAAGGYNKHAKLRSVLIVRDAYSEKPDLFLVDLYKVIKDGNTSENILLSPKDIVYIPKTFIGDIGDLMDFFMSRVRPAADTYFLAEIAKK